MSANRSEAKVAAHPVANGRYERFSNGLGLAGDVAIPAVQRVVVN
jgi:hypothetical protein